MIKDGYCNITVRRKENGVHCAVRLLEETREVVKASGHQRARKDWELTAAAEIWLQMLLEIGSWDR